MSQEVEANKLVVRAIFAKALANSEAGAFAAYAEADAVEHGTRGTSRFDVGSFRLALSGLATRDINLAIEDLIGESDKVVARLTVSGISKERFQSTNPRDFAAGFAIEHIHIFRLRSGRVTDHWYVRDELQLLEQLGILPT